MNTKKYIIIFILCIIFSSLVAVSLLQRPCWDFYGHHYYNGWAFLNGRIDTDFLACYHRSYYNPILDVIYYFIITKLNNHPFLYNIVLHLKYGIFLFISYLFYNFILKEQKYTKNSGIYCALLLLIFSPIVINCLKIYFFDIEQALFALISLFITVKILFDDSISVKNKVILSLLAGGIMGLSAGIKYTIASAGIALLLSICLLKKNIKNWIEIAISYLLGLISGFLISGGWWVYLLYKKFHNPIFPFFNNVFNSPMADSTPVLDFDYIYLRSESFIDYILSPIRSTFSHLNGYEEQYYDIKMPIFAISIAMICLLFFMNKDIKNKINEIIDVNILKFLVSFIIINYYINLYVFAQYRYILLLYSLAPIIIVITCNLLSSSKKIYQYLFMISILSVILYHFYYDFKYHSIFGKMYEYTSYATKVAICILILILFLMYKIKAPKVIYTVFLVGILVCNICTYIMEPNFIQRENIKENPRMIYIKDMKIPDDSIVFMGTMQAPFVATAQNKKSKYYGYVLPEHIAQEAYWTNHLYANKYYQNKYLENMIKDIFSKYKKLYIIFNSYELQGDIELYNESIKYYSQDKFSGVTNCQAIDYEVFGLYNFFDVYTICEIK